MRSLTDDRIEAADLPVPGWYDDPGAPGRLRYWDGTSWTEDRMVRPGQEAPHDEGPGREQATDPTVAPAVGDVGPPTPVPAPDEHGDDVESSRVGRIVVLVSAVATLVGFFLPWVHSSGFLSGNYFGADLATTAESAASGKDLRVLLLVPVAAVVGALLALPPARRRLGRLASVLTLVGVGLGLLVVPVVLPDELSYWSGGELSYTYGLWLSMLGLVGIAVGTVLQLVTPDRVAGTRADEAGPEAPPAPVDLTGARIVGGFGVLAGALLLGGLYPEFLAGRAKIDSLGGDYQGYLLSEAAPGLALLVIGALTFTGTVRHGGWGLLGVVAGSIGWWVLEPLVVIEVRSVSDLFELAGPGLWLQGLGFAAAIAGGVVGIVRSRPRLAPPPPAWSWLPGLGAGALYALGWAMDWFTVGGRLACCSPFTDAGFNVGLTFTGTSARTQSVLLVMLLALTTATLAAWMRPSGAGAALALGLAVPALGVAAWVVDVALIGAGPSMATGAVVLVVGALALVALAVLLWRRGRLEVPTPRVPRP